jgi:hypothetical protein
MRRALSSMVVVLLLSSPAFAQTTALSAEDKSDIQALVTGYARALATCNAE